MLYRFAYYAYRRIQYFLSIYKALRFLPLLIDKNCSISSMLFRYSHFARRGVAVLDLFRRYDD